MKTRPRSLSLTWRFAIASLVLMTVLSVGFGYGVLTFLSAKFNGHALDDTEANARDMVARRVRDNLRPEELQQPLQGKRLDEFDAFLSQSVLSRHTLRVVVWSLDGQVIYSDDRSQIGQTPPMSEDRAKALRGVVSSELSDDGGHDMAGGTDGKLVEVYVPVTYEGSPEIRGIFEVYQSYAPFAGQVGAMRKWVTFSMLGGFGVLWFALLAIVSQGVRTIARQHRELEAALEARVQAEHARARLAAIVHSTSDMVGTADPEGNILYLNRAAQDTLGASDDPDLLGGDLLEVYAEEEREKIANVALPTARSLGTWSGETKVIGKDSQPIPVSQVFVWHAGESGADKFYSFDARSISERVTLEQRLKEMATQDLLTGLLNQRGFYEAMIRNLEAEGASGALAFIDLDGFKAVNDRAGHHAGDELLASVGSLCKASFRETDVIARMGGDEFAIYMPSIDSRGAIAAAWRIASAVSRHRISVDGATLGVSASIGLAFFPEHATCVDQLLSCADSAMYRAKQACDTLRVYDPDATTVMYDLKDPGARLERELGA